VAQDLELGRGQADPLVAALDASALEIDEQVAMADDPPAGGVREIAVGSPRRALIRLISSRSRTASSGNRRRPARDR
jgi:hypothetical protein